jgi:hypothetical protein
MLGYGLYVVCPSGFKMILENCHVNIVLPLTTLSRAMRSSIVCWPFERSILQAAMIGLSRWKKRHVFRQ